METAFAWTFESRYQRGKQWYLVASTLIITAVVVSFLVGAYLLGIVFILFAGVYLLYDVNTHPEVRVQITTNGIYVNESLYSYNRIESFAVLAVENFPSVLRLKLVSKSVGSMDLFVEPSIETEVLRTFLKNYLTEDPDAQLTTVQRLLMGLRL